MGQHNRRSIDVGDEMNTDRRRRRRREVRGTGLS